MDIMDGPCIGKVHTCGDRIPILCVTVKNGKNPHKVRKRGITIYAALLPSLPISGCDGWSHRACCVSSDPTLSHHGLFPAIVHGQAHRTIGGAPWGCQWISVSLQDRAQGTDKTPTCRGRPNTRTIHNIRSKPPRIVARLACHYPGMDCPQSVFWSN